MVSPLGNQGIVYVLDEDNCILQEFSGSTTTVLAGTGTCGSASGDGGLATSAALSDPLKVALDGAGDIYIVDDRSENVRRIDALSGIITTVAGTSGTVGYTADGGLAVDAALDEPQAIALDSVGNLYIAEAGSQLVRKVDALSGILTTVAGNYQAGVAGYTGDGGPATSAQLNYPDALAVDGAGNILIADDGNNAIRKVTATTGIITTIAGTGTAGYSGDGGPGPSAMIDDPEGVSVDAAGNAYIADSSNRLVRRVDAITGIITTVAGVYNGGVDAYTGDGGPATQAGLSYVEDVAVSNGLIAIADSDNNVIRYVITAVGDLNFGSTNVGSSSSAQNVQFSNDGTSTLNVNSLALGADFSLGGANTTCNGTTTLTAGASCVFGIEFVPTSNGAISEGLMIADNENNDPYAQQNIELMGTGVLMVGPAAMLASSGIPATTAIGGNLGTNTALIEDANGNVVTSSSAVVTETITGPGGYSQVVTATAVNGIATFDLSAYPLNTAGSYTVTTTSPDLTSSISNVLVSNAPTKLQLVGVASSVATGGNLGTVTVQVENGQGAVATSATNSVTVTITGPGGYSQTVTGTAVNGVVSFDLSGDALSPAGSYTVTATSSGLTMASLPVTVAAGGAAAKLANNGIPATNRCGRQPGHQHGDDRGCKRRCRHRFVCGGDGDDHGSGRILADSDGNGGQRRGDIQPEHARTDSGWYLHGDDKQRGTNVFGHDGAGDRRRGEACQQRHPRIGCHGRQPGREYSGD